MKIRHVYTVVREFTTKKKELKDEIDSFRGVEDEAGEYLYGGSAESEKIDVKLQAFDGKEWKGIVVP